jgi:hypothetical protein
MGDAGLVCAFARRALWSFFAHNFKFGTKTALKTAKLTEGPWLLERVKGIEPSIQTLKILNILKIKGL